MLNINNLLSVDMTTIIYIVILAAIIILMFVMPMINNKKRNQQVNDLYNSVKPGDKIKTVGGIVGTVVEIRENTDAGKVMILKLGEGDNKVDVMFDFQALYQNLTHQAQVAAAKAQDELKAEENHNKKDNNEDNIQ